MLLCFRSHSKWFVYDSTTGRLIEKDGFDSGNNQVSTVTYHYDTGDTGYTVYPGQLFSVVDDQGWQKFSYDVRGRTLVSSRYLSKTGQTYITTDVYDDADRLITSTFPGATPPTVQYSYNTAGIPYLAKGNIPGGPLFTYYDATSFDEFRRVTGVLFGNRTTTTYGYYATSKRLKTLVTTLPSGSRVQSLAHSYDADGNFTAVTDQLTPSGAASSTFSGAVYDDLNRLVWIQWANAPVAKTFTYAAIGNLLVNGEAGAGTYAYNTSNPNITSRPHAVKYANGLYYTYDLNGNMVYRGMQTLGYDVHNRLTGVTNVNGTVVNFGYADDGERLWEQGPSGLHLWIGNNYEERAGKVLYHVMVGGRRVCTFEPAAAGTIYNPTTEEFYYYHPDHLGSSTIMTDRNAVGAIQHYVYSAFGRDQYVKSTTAFPVSHRFTGQVVDIDTGLYFYNARYYDPQLGRFIQPDSIIPDFANPQSINRYSYCVNNPLRYTDPSGHGPGAFDEGAIALRVTLRNGGTVQEAITRMNKIDQVSSSAFTGSLVATVTSTLVGIAAPEGLTLAGRLAWSGLAGGTGSYAGNGVANKLNGQSFNKNAGEAIIVGAALGAAAQGISEFGSLNTPPKVLTLNGDKYPVSAANLEEAGAVNTPLPVNRTGAPANRAKALGGLPKIPGYDLDEAPPAMLRKPGDPVVVRPTPSADNRGAGASLGNQSKSVPEGGKVIIKIQRKGQ